MGANWTTTGQLRLPNTATPTGVTVTPSGAAWVNSAWASLGSPSTAGLLTGLTCRTAFDGFAQFVIELGSGGDGSQSVIAGFCGHARAISNVSNSGMVFRLPLLVDALTASVPVWARIRMHVTDTTVWQMSATYYPKPITGSLETGNGQATYPTVTDFPELDDGGTVAPSWTPGPWVVMAASIATDIVITGICIWVFSGHEQDFQVQIGYGPTDPPTVLMTLKGQIVQNGIPFSTQIPNPRGPVAAGSKLWMRVTADVTNPYGGSQWFGALAYVPV
jgi:hypothetical protein